MEPNMSSIHSTMSSNSLLAFPCLVVLASSLKIADAIGASGFRILRCAAGRRLFCKERHVSISFPLGSTHRDLFGFNLVESAIVCNIEVLADAKCVLIEMLRLVPRCTTQSPVDLTLKDASQEREVVVHLHDVGLLCQPETSVWASLILHADLAGVVSRYMGRNLRTRILS